MAKAMAGISMVGVVLFVLAGLLFVCAPGLAKAVAQMDQGAADMSTAPEVGLLSEIPLTRHAQISHVNETYNARTLPRMIDGGICKPKMMYLCVGGDTPPTARIICQVTPDLWGGVIIGLNGNGPVIVTGYAAPLDYWQRVLDRDKCMGAGLR